MLSEGSQIFRLVNSGTPDRMLAFNKLPDDLLKGVEKSNGEGLPRYWKQYGTQYVLIYIGVNKDKERWSEIQSFVHQNVNKDFRVMDDLLNMAKPMAKDSKAELSLEPEDIIEIPIVSQVRDEPETILPPVQEKALEEVIKQKPKIDVKKELLRDRLKHNCSHGGRGRLSDVGKCPRCDQIRAIKQAA